MGCVSGIAQAQTTDSSSQNLALHAESLRSSLTDAQLELSFDPATGVQLVQKAQREFATTLKTPLSAVQPQLANSVSRDLERALSAAQSGDEAGLARARSSAWTGLLGASYAALEYSIAQGDLNAASRWLALREYRPVVRFARVGAGATLALEDLFTQKISTAAALEAVQADLLDGYQARLNESLEAYKLATDQGFRVRAAELSTLSSGYFEILAPAYQKALGEAKLRTGRAAFIALEQNGAGALVRVKAALEGFRAAPLTEQEIRQRAGQTLRFLSLVPLEYGRGVSGAAGAVVVKRDIEIVEAKTFLAGAHTALSDLEPQLVKMDRTSLERVLESLRGVQSDLERAGRHDDPVTAQVLEGKVQATVSQLEALFPAAWQRKDAAGDLEVMRSQVAAVLGAVRAGDFELAENSRLDAYATLEAGPEARIAVFAPDLKLRLESLFWNGDSPKGLARLIREKGSPTEFETTQKALEAAFRDTARFLGNESSPVAVGGNAGIIVFREGLEAVLILAALLGSLKRPEVRPLRKPLWVGAWLALLASGVTWVLMQGLLGFFSRFGEKLEAVVSVVAIAVLLVIMNWFFHNVYWTDRLASFHQQKSKLMGRGVGQWVGLVLLGFTSIYREGFETVLFLQSLILQAGSGVVLLGTLVGLAAVFFVGWLIFALQTKLPHKKMLIATGAMIVGVLFMMMGNTTHVLQLVGWFPVHSIAGLSISTALSTWLGIYATWEGILMQILGPALIVGSYFLAEGAKSGKLERRQRVAQSH